MMTSSNDTGHSPFPSLPIISPDPPPRSQREKYGLLFLAGIAGLIILIMLVGWFGYRVWNLREVWANVYTLHDVTRSQDERIQAAFSLSRDPRVEQRQLWDMSLTLGLPDLARYVLAEGVGAELVAQDPQAFVAAVARSPDWPGWLRLALTRPLAYASSQGHTISRERLGELTRLGDPVIRLWALYALAVQARPDPQTVVEIERVYREAAPERELAGLLLAAIRGGEIERAASLAKATEWNREHHAETKRLLQGWELRQGSLTRTAEKG
jgi:hypothetical protein